MSLLDGIRVVLTASDASTLTLGAKVQGFNATSDSWSGAQDGQLYSWVIEANFDGSGVAQAREGGHGTYTSSTGVLARTTVWSTATNNAQISITGTSHVIITPLSQDLRLCLTASTTYYVRSNGSDSNSGLANTAGGAFLTIQKAMDVIACTLDLAGFTVTVQLADATYTGALTVKPCVGQAGPASLVFQGNSGTPGNVVLTVTSSDLVTLNPGSMAYFKDMELRTATSGNGVQVNSGTFYWSNIRFGAIHGAQISLFGPSLGFCQGNYSIVGAATYHLQAYNGGHFEIANRTITLTGTPAFTDFVYADSSCSVNIYGNTFSGSATGSRFNVTASSVIQTYGAGLTALPGNASGTADTATGGFYS